MIRVTNATKYYGSHCAVRDLDFTIGDGECVGFLGLNGAGKSTTLRMLSCLLLPTSGSVTVHGLDAESDPHAIRKLIGYLPERPPVYGEMTVREDLVFAGKLRGITGTKLAQRLADTIETCSLTDVAQAPIDTLSHGYRQRVGIAQAIIHEPSLLILDEPMQGLDPVQIVQMRAMIRGLRGRHTILLSTHMLHEIEATCDRILVLNEGRVAAHGTEAELAREFGAGGRFELLVAGDEDVVIATLEALDGVSDVHVEAAPDGWRVQLHLTGDGAGRGALARAVVEAGQELLELRRVTSGLESVFLGLQERGVTGEAA